MDWRLSHLSFLCPDFLRRTQTIRGNLTPSYQLSVSTPLVQSSIVVCSTVYTLKSGPSPNVSPKVAGLTQAKMMIRDHILCRKYIPKSLHNLAQPFYILDYIQLCTAADDCTGCVQRPVQWRRDRERERLQIHACAVDTHHIMKGKVDLCFDII